jgi:hypothetical protein
MANQRISPETAARITAAWPDLLERLARGELVRDALAANALNADALRAFKAGDAARRVEWDEAREASADAFMDQALETANNPAVDPAHARVKIDTLKWAARIRNPRHYGEKMQLDVKHDVDLREIINAAHARIAAAQVGRVIEGVVVRAALPQLADLV